MIPRDVLESGGYGWASREHTRNTTTKPDVGGCNGHTNRSLGRSTDDEATSVELKNVRTTQENEYGDDDC